MKIDVHHHYLPKAYLDNVSTYLPEGLDVDLQGNIMTFIRREDGYVYPRLDVRSWGDIDVQLADMDAAGVDHAVLSSACFQDWMTMEAARIINDGTADVVARHPDRFSGMISVPPDGGEEMVREIERGRDELGLCAINLTTTHKGRFPDHEDFKLLFATANDLNLPVYVHPSWHGPNTQNMEDWNLDRTIGKATDLNLSIARMLFSGRFNDLPSLRMLFAHLGGSLPVTITRLFYGQKGWLSEPDFDYPSLLKRVFVDTAPGMWQSPMQIEIGAKAIGADQMMLGSDYPLSNNPAQVIRDAVNHVLHADLPDADKEKIFSANARAFFALDHLSNCEGCAPGRSSTNLGSAHSH